MKYFIHILFPIYVMAHNQNECNKIYDHVENQYEYYQEIIESEHMIDRDYIEGKRDAYREMCHFLEIYLYRVG